MTSSTRYLNGMGDLMPWANAPVTRMVRVRLPFPRKAGLGDDGDGGETYDASQLAQSGIAEAPSLLQGVAQLVKASNTPGIPYSGVGLAVPETTSSVIAGSSTGLTSSGSSLGLLLLLGLAAVAAMAVSGNK